MTINNTKLVPFRLIHPGEILKEELLERNIKINDFAASLGVSSDFLKDFLNGKGIVSASFAVKLENLLGISRTTWMNLFSNYVHDSINAYKNKTKPAPTINTVCKRVRL